MTRSVATRPPSTTVGPSRRGPRRLMETGVGLVAVMLAAGVATGILLSRGTDPNHPAPLADGLSWLRDLTRGEAVQVNPDTGREENRLAVAPAGQDWQLSQRDGLLVITTADGTVTVIDVATLSITGTYGSGPASSVLLDDDNLYVVDAAAGTITRLDPATATLQGRPFSTPNPVADATIDGTGTVWAVDITGLLHQLAWTGTTLTPTGPATAIPGAGSATVLVAHPAGVTALSPERRTATRVGTAADTTIVTPGLAAPLRAARNTPTTLAAATTDGTPTLNIIGVTTATTIDTSRYNCDRPDRPAVHNRHIYVPCRGTGRVIVLDAAGAHTPPDLTLGPTGDPQLATHHDTLYAMLPGPDTTGYAIDARGTPTPLDLTNPETPAQAPKPRTHNQPTPRNGGDNGGGGGAPSGGTGSSPSPSPSPQQPAQPTTGDSVIKRIDETTSCGDPCRILRYRYSAVVAPPVWWGSNPGTCTLVANRISGVNRVTTPIPCGTAQTVFLFVGDGDTYTVTARFCDPDCTDSNTLEFFAFPPEQIGDPYPPCREVSCQIP